MVPTRRNPNCAWLLFWILIPLGVMISASWSQTGGWARKADMPTARYGLATGVVDGKIYAIGGDVTTNDGSTPWSYSPAMEMYDPATDSWTQLADMPTPRAMLAVSVVDGVIYAMGGNGPDVEPVRIVEAYDPATGRWVRKADMPSQRSHFSTSAVDGRIYAFGGLKSSMGNPNLSVDEYDPVTDRWSVRLEEPRDRSNAPIHLSASMHSTSVVDGRIYLVGALWGEGRTTVFDPNSATWTSETSAPTPRRSLSTCVVEGRIYAIGGRTMGDDDVWGWQADFVPMVEAYDPATRSWAPIPDMTVARADLAASAVDGTIYAIGGRADEHGAIPALGTVEAFTPGVWHTSVRVLSWGTVKVLMRR